MKIISYNVNGIRAAISKGFIDWLKEEDADVYCLQEVKADSHQLELEIIRNLGYQIYWHSAVKKGYSGVAIFSKKTPLNVEAGCKIKDYDTEGRILRADFEDFSIINVYIPSGSSGELRQAYKMTWLEDFHNYIMELKNTYRNLIICGDYNICHKPIDIHNPVSNKNSSGFLPEEREWLSGFIDLGFIDSFRYFNKEPHQYTWWSYRANSREKNLGWRIDYHMVSKEMEIKLKSAKILADVIHSDHCPLVLEID